MPDDRYSKRMTELIGVGEALLAKSSPSVSGFDAVDTPIAYEWATNVLQVLKATLGEGSDHYRQALAHTDGIWRTSEVMRVQAFLKAARSDWDGGYAAEVRQLVEADVCSDLLEQATVLLKSKYHRAAAVIAGAVLEKHLRSMCCARDGIDLVLPTGAPKDMELLNVALAKYSPPAYDGHWAKQIRPWADLRNHAAHGADFDESAVPAMVDGIGAFCARFK